jgi:hypothetical protein
MAGSYVFGDCTSSIVYRAAMNPTRTGFAGTPERISTDAATPADFVAGPDGAIYYTAIGDGEVRRLAAVTIGDDALLAGAVLTLKVNPLHATQKSLNTSSKDPAIDLGDGPGSADDPTLGGGSVRILSTAGGFDNTYPLPASRWRYNPAAKGYFYTDPRRASGPVTSATLKDGKLLQVLGKGAQLGHTLGSNPDPVTIVLQVGAKRYCMSFGAGATTTFTAGKEFSAKNAPAPGACPP